MDQAGVIAAFGEDRFDPVFLTESFVLANELDLDTGLGGDGLGIDAQLIAQRLRPFWKVKYANLVIGQIAGHRPGVADIRQCPCEYDTVEAGDHTCNVIFMAFDKGVHDDNTVVLFLVLGKECLEYSINMVLAMPG